ncbi:Glycosyl hydrolase family 81 [uncultured virus]|nr:Glycosyl hydrolase family 81 [uncultured virus]
MLPNEQGTMRRCGDARPQAASAVAGCGSVVPAAAQQCSLRNPSQCGGNPQTGAGYCDDPPACDPAAASCILPGCPLPVGARYCSDDPPVPGPPSPSPTPTPLPEPPPPVPPVPSQPYYSLLDPRALSPPMIAGEYALPRPPHPQRLQGWTNSALPTQHFMQNAFYTDNGLLGAGTIASLPYWWRIVDADTPGFDPAPHASCYFPPEPQAVVVQTPGQNDQPPDANLETIFVPDMTEQFAASMVEPQLDSPVLVGLGPMHGTFRFRASPPAAGYLDVPIVKGATFCTFVYDACTPRLLTALGIQSFSIGSQTYAVGPAFVLPPAPVVTVNFLPATPDSQPTTWLLCSDPPLGWQVNAGATQLIAADVYTGVLQAAFLTPGRETEDAALYSHYRGAYPYSATVDYAVSSVGGANDAASIRFTWERRGGNAACGLLMAALPHHVATLSSPTQPQSILYPNTVCGPMATYAGDEWTMLELLTGRAWADGSTLTAAQRQSVATSLELDFEALLWQGYGSVYSASTYTAGQAIATLVRLMELSDAVGDGVSNAAALQLNVAAGVRFLQSAVFEPWFSGRPYVEQPCTSPPSDPCNPGVGGCNVPQPFLYETAWGGLVSWPGTDGLCNYGNASYDDRKHILYRFAFRSLIADHFHYGYWMYALAYVAKRDPAWAAQWNEAILLLARDVGNPGDSDPYFASYRHKDWYSATSWATGIIPGTARGQESSSEAINCYFALALLGRSLNNGVMSDAGRVCLALEVRAAQTYYQLTAANADNYPAAFFENSQEVSILFMTFAAYDLYWPCAPDSWPQRHACMTMIEVLPVTEITRDAVQTAWIDAVTPKMQRAIAAGLTPAWQTYSWQLLGTLPSFNDAALSQIVASAPADYHVSNSRSNALYWLLTHTPGLSGGTLQQRRHGQRTWPAGACETRPNSNVVLYLLLLALAILLALSALLYMTRGRSRMM